MRIVTRDDIQGIGDAASLLAFLREKFAVPIAEDATLEQIARPFPLPYLRLEDAVAAQVIECQELRVRTGDASGTRQPFLIRFREETGYLEILLHVGKGLQLQGYDAEDFGFLCVDEHFCPFALASFEGAELTIRSWGEQQARIHIDSVHEIHADFFPMKQEPPAIAEVRSNQPEPPVNEEATPLVPEPGIVVSPSSDALLAKIENAGTPLGEVIDRDRLKRRIETGRIETACKMAFLIDEPKREQLIGEDAKSDELIKPVIGRLQVKRWQLIPKYLIFIPSSKFRKWPWSGRDESEAERIFANEYPAIHEHLNGYRDKVKSRSRQGEFYWELAMRAEYPEFRDPKIAYRCGFAIQATYDISGAIVIHGGGFIPSADRSLLAILNSKLLHFYAQARYQSTYNRPRGAKNWIDFYEPGQDYRLYSIPVADRTEKQKATIAEYVQAILDDPDSHEVPAIEEEIDAWVYNLYRLTPAEIALIEETSRMSREIPL